MKKYYLKEDVEFERLEEFGFEFVPKAGHPFNCFDLFHKETDDKIHIEIFTDFRDIVFYKNELYEDDETILKYNIEQYIQDLLEANLVEERDE